MKGTSNRPSGWRTVPSSVHGRSWLPRAEGLLRLGHRVLFFTRLPWTLSSSGAPPHFTVEGAAAQM